MAQRAYTFALPVWMRAKPSKLFAMIFFALALALAFVLLLLVIGQGRCQQPLRRRRPEPMPVASTGFPQRKPDWVRHAVLELHEYSHLSHRQLAATFNRLHFARTGISVGRTWVRELLSQQAYREMERRRACKHRVPPSLPANRCWGFDTTFVHDGTGIVFGLIDHGSRLNLALHTLSRFNRWTLLGGLFLAIGP